MSDSLEIWRLSTSYAPRVNARDAMAAESQAVCKATLTLPALPSRFSIAKVKSLFIDFNEATCILYHLVVAASCTIESPTFKSVACAQSTPVLGFTNSAENEKAAVPISWINTLSLVAT